LLVERVLAVLVALLLGAPHRLAQIVHLRRHLLLRGLLALILVDAAGLARGLLEVLRWPLAFLLLVLLLDAVLVFLLLLVLEVLGGLLEILGQPLERLALRRLLLVLLILLELLELVLLLLELRVYFAQ